MTPRRLGAVLQALGELEVLLNDLHSQQPIAMRSEPRVVDICRIINNEVLAIEAAARGQGVVFRVEQCASAHAHCLSFMGDPIRIGQVIKNLLLNAIRYTPSGGTVTVDCRREPDAFRFSVANDGPGIPAADVPHIFEPGFRCPPWHDRGRNLRRTRRTLYGPLPDAQSPVPSCSGCAALTTSRAG